MRTWILLVALSCTMSTCHGGDIALLPSKFTLGGSEARQRLVVARVQDDLLGAVIDDAQLTSSDPSVVKISGSVASAVSDGTATITAVKDGHESSATVTVKATGEKHRWNFRNDVQSVLAKAGCNMGACHGALAGKGGFRLSLRGYDSKADFFSITRQARGRRIELSDPGRSLLIAKPTGALPHKGGLKLDVDSRNYQVLSQWIANGAQGPTDDDKQLLSLSVLPEAALLNPNNESQILVNAHYDDGSIVDVTQWAQFSSTDEAVASVNDEGRISVRGSGEGAVLVWFGSKVALSRLTVPYQHSVPAKVYDVAPRRNFIDEINLNQLRTLKLRPSPRCDDGAFVRRATLDTIGRLPTLEEQRTFFADSSQRRDHLIERLLASEDFVAYWTYRWSDVLVINGTRLRPVAVMSYYKWLNEAVRANKPWDEIVREVLTATGKSNENGATNFYALNQSPEDMTENACQAFMGLSIGCAKCHNHPLEKWTNDQYYAMANLFARVRAKGWGGDGRNGNGLRTLYVAKSGDLIQPKLGKPQQPAPLDSDPLAFDDPVDRRVALANWMTNPDNPYFARAIANRVWANFFGRGLIEQVDDLRLSNPASCEPLLNAAAKHVVEAKFDLKELMRTILQSETYQRSSVSLTDNAMESKYLSRYYPRRLMAEVLLDSIDQVLGTSTSFTEVAFPGADRQKTEFYKKGTRAIELYDAAVNSYFLKTFGRNPREITCECERSDEPSMVQVLHLSNGDTLNPKLTANDSVIVRMIKSGADNATIIDRLFTAALMRKPTAAERKNLMSIIDEYKDDRRTALQDVAWSVLTSGEFTFNH